MVGRVLLIFQYVMRILIGLNGFEGMLLPFY
jgi:hypothetical protein